MLAHLACGVLPEGTSKIEDCLTGLGMYAVVRILMEQPRSTMIEDLVISFRSCDLVAIQVPTNLTAPLRQFPNALPLASATSALTDNRANRQPPRRRRRHEEQGAAVTDQQPQLGITIPRDLLEQFVGCDLTDAQVTRIQECLVHSSVPDALATIAGQFVDHPDDGDDDPDDDDDDDGEARSDPPNRGAFCPNGDNHGRNPTGHPAPPVQHSVLVTVAADGDTAVVDLPGGLTCQAGRVADSGLYWVADEVGTVVAHSPFWPEVGHILARAYGYLTDIAVVVEYADAADSTGTAASTDPASDAPSPPT